MPKYKVEIWKGGEMVCGSRNLRGIRTYAGKHLVRECRVIGRFDGTGTMDVIFRDGATCDSVEWASWQVAADWARKRRVFYGATLEVHRPDGHVLREAVGRRACRECGRKGWSIFNATFGADSYPGDVQRCDNCQHLPDDDAAIAAARAAGLSVADDGRVQR